MTYVDIRHYDAINEVDETKVIEIAESIKNNGWLGCPILYCEGYGLVTGSHRISALNYLYENDWDFDESIECAEDVSDIINVYCEENDMCFDDIDFSNIGVIFENTWVEEYKDEIAEW